MAQFEVGKKVIALTNNSQDYYKRGDVFHLYQTKEGACSCVPVLLDIGLKIVERHEYYWQACAICRKETKPSRDDTAWFGCHDFAPYDDSLSDTTIEQLLEEIETETVTI